MKQVIIIIENTQVGKNLQFKFSNCTFDTFSDVAMLCENCKCDCETVNKFITMLNNRDATLDNKIFAVVNVKR
jgi:hypothetical protein